MALLNRAEQAADGLSRPDDDRSPARPPARRLRVLLILGHPRPDSLSGALAAAYAEGARRAGAVVEELRVAELRFEPDVTTPSISQQAVEDDVRRAQELIAWADHLAFVYPTWWGTMPARLKGFLDRVLTPGFAFAEREDGRGWDPLLKGKSAELLTTMDTPRWVYRWIFKAPGHNAMSRATLGFCGVEVSRIASFGPVRDSSPERRRGWIADARERGFGLARGVFSPRQRARRKLASWLRAVRLQFYPMTWLAYGLGALAAASLTGGFDPAAFWWGLACLFFLEVATVFSNEYVDHESDRRNRNFGPFNGGSRVLVDGRLSFREVRCGIAAALVLAALCAGGLISATAAPPVAAAAVLLGMAVLALGYTVPPLKLCYRGLGELDVGITHSVGVILCGFVFQGGAWHSLLPWLLGLPLFLAVLPGIILAGIPDHDADRAVSKGTVAVRTGIQGAYLAAGAFTVLAAAAAVALQQTAAFREAFAGIHYVVLPHAAALLLVLARSMRENQGSARIDGLMTVALAYTVWFGAVPLIGLL